MGQPEKNGSGMHPNRYSVRDVSCRPHFSTLSASPRLEGAGAGWNADGDRLEVEPGLAVKDAQ